jgi:hypothetical protein
MFTDDLSYYAEISILVDGWPWNLSEFDFRAWFAPGSCPQALLTTVIEVKKPQIAVSVAASGNRRASRKQKKREKRRQAA